MFFLVHHDLTEDDVQCLHDEARLVYQVHNIEVCLLGHLAFMNQIM